VTVERESLDYGVIGNGRVIALVSPAGRIDWLCLPRFDSPSIFAALLDAERGGHFGIESADPVIDASMAYERNTNVLRTEVRTGEGRYAIFDYAPWVPGLLRSTSPLEIHRLIVPLGGAPRIRIDFDPRPSYGREHPDPILVAGGLEVPCGGARVHLRTNVPATWVLGRQAFRLGSPTFLALSWGRPPEADTVHAVQERRDLTVAAWRDWARSCSLPAFAAEAVLRSALCLKLLQFADTGAFVAAATTSIPEALGTERTWDYRYCWLRDSAFVVEALRRIGHVAEGESFIRFLRTVAEGGPLQPLYGVGGERDLSEWTLDHMRGFGGAQPIRIGNAAFRQQQHDLMGEVVLCLESLLTDPRSADGDAERVLPLVERLVEDAIRLAPTMDTGIWEYRTEPGFYTFSQALCWVAAQRGARLARLYGRAGLADRWQRWADGQRDRVLTEGFNVERGCFTQKLGGVHADAANLLLPVFGIVEARDPRFLSTLKVYETALVDRGLMLRYRHDDDFGTTTSALTMCSFWWAEMLAMTGDLDAATELFGRLLGHANPLGLFSEDIDPATGRLLGNFPQAYTHVGLVHAAATIGGLLEARDGRFRAWT
jgi:GH15 family glucan-1,4-alpha-glucosidase